MFTKDDIGKKVVSDFFGIGVITHFSSHRAPVGVMFNSVKWQFAYGVLKTMPDCYYYADGTLCTMSKVPREDCRIRLLAVDEVIVRN